MNKFFELDSFSKSIITGETQVDDIYKEGFERGLEIYKSNYLLSLIQSLKNKYEVILIVLGEDNFNFFAKKYVYSNSSTKPNIDEYGVSFGDFLSEQEELEAMGYLSYIGEIDLFWFQLNGTSISSIEIPKGVLALWGSLRNDTELDNIEIDEDETEEIYAIEQNNEIHLIAK